MSNVRVAVRLKPSLDASRAPRLAYSIEEAETGSEGSLVIQRGQTSKEFQFDHVYGEDATNASVFSSSVAMVVHQCLLGYNATIFAYGQSGSGKTFSMGTATAELNTANEGVIPRALRYIFGRVATDESSTYRILASFIEIYNDELIDLLSNGETKEMHIREDSVNRIVVAGSRECRVESVEDAYEVLQIGNAARSTAATNMNDESSRSHAIFTLSVEVLTREDRRLASKLHMVDLAGSERTKRTGAVGIRLRESVGINQGLMSLGRVIRALALPRTSAHVPYRESKLTRFLQDSLGGTSHTLMIACVSMAAENTSETLSTLEYAAKARLVRNNVVVNEVSRRARADVVEALRAQILSMQTCGGGHEALTCLARVQPLVLRMRDQLCVGDAATTDVRRVVEELTAYACARDADSMQPLIQDEADLRAQLEESRADLARDEELYAAKVMELSASRKRERALERECNGLRAELGRVSLLEAAFQRSTGAGRPGSAPQPSDADMAALRRLVEARESLVEERRQLERRNLEAVRLVEEDEEDAAEAKKRLAAVQEKMRHRSATDANVSIIRENSFRLGQTYDARILELEGVVAATRSEVSEAVGDARTELAKRLERAEDELEVLHIRYDQQRKGFRDALDAEDGKEEGKEVGEGDLRWLRREESRLQRCVRDEADERSARREHAALVERRLRDVVDSLARTEEQLAAHSAAEVALCGASAASLLRRYAPLVETHFKKNKRHLKAFLMNIDDVVSAERSVDISMPYVQSLQAEFEQKTKMKSMLEDRLARQSSESKESFEDADMAVREVAAELDLLKIRMIEASRTPRDTPRSRDSRRGRAAADVESLEKAVRGMDVDLCRDAALLLARVVSSVAADSLNSSAKVDELEQQNATLLHEQRQMQEAHDGALKSTRVEYEEKIVFLLQQIRSVEEKRRRSSKSNHALSSDGFEGSPRKPKTASTIESFEPVSPGKSESGAYQSSDIDMAKVVGKWKAELQRRSQLEKRNSELVREIRQLKGEDT